MDDQTKNTRNLETGILYIGKYIREIFIKVNSVVHLQDAIGEEQIPPGNLRVSEIILLSVV